ncbi:MAG: DsbA family oxidoreductase [Acidimicrobiia bacterium]|nr:DsbA family oxidoreductase [Acidimicrobiia bacterium]
MLSIEIWSDVICPWCFLGKRRFDRAVVEFDGAVEVEVRWRAYQLDPTATSTPSDLRTSLEKKYGPGSFDAMTGRLVPLGAAEGIEYRFDLAQRVSTISAHRLLAWAWEHGGGTAQARLAEELFVAYFERGANVADHEQLVDIAEAAGLDAEQAKAVLIGDHHRDEVAADLEAASEREITGVPAFVIADRLLIPGAQEVDTFRQVLQRAAERFS